MLRKYMNYTDHGKRSYELYMPNDFRYSKVEGKSIIIHKLNLYNSNGQLMFCCYLCGNFATDTTYSFGLIGDYIMSSNELNPKQILVKSNLNNMKFWFKDYKGKLIEEADDFYFTLEYELVY